MATLPYETSSPLANPEQKWKLANVPPDLKVEITTDPDADPQDPGFFHSIEVSWDDDGKVSAQLEIFDGIAHIDNVGRPPHWGEDTRPPSEQEAEYVFGLEMILKRVIRLHSGPIEIKRQSGIVANALLDLKNPSGLKRQLKVEQYESGWHSSDQFDLRQAVAEGAQIAARYEKDLSPQPELGKVATASFLEAPVLKIA